VTFALPTEAAVDTDRNLHFGVLALQLELIDRDAFVGACLNWARRQDTALADILVSQGLLAPDARAEVERRLSMHGADVRASLAGSVDTSARGAFTDTGDDLSHSEAPTQPQGVAGAVIGSPGSDAPRYMMLRLAGTGGIGQVWLARDASLGREVALKELRPDRADPGFWGRFVREAQVTGQLEHPAIVPVYDVGRRPQDNQPFYTMRFVRGRTLKDAVALYHERRGRDEAGPLELRELLGAFVQVCNAVGYAHSRGVLHRDLKPHNVALGDFGEVMVLDWGLAKVLSETPAANGKSESGVSPGASGVTPGGAQDPTRADDVLGTPAYMAPEQADCRHDLIDVRTDVYGLGAILYQTLTGSAPFAGGATDAVLDRVRHEPPPRPRELVGTPPALEAICLKALAKRREDRYPSAQALAQEVQRFLADEPVTAYRDPPTVRLTRWGRRHRTTVTAAAALLLTATVALAVGLVAVKAEKDRTALAEKQARQALEAETAALNRSLKAEQSAGEQRQLALKTVRGVVDDVQARLKDVPAQQELRKALLGRAQVGLTEVARAADTAAAIDHATVRVHFELGDIFLEIEEGGSAEAKRQYERAYEMAKQIADANPARTDAQRDLSIAHDKLGDLSLRLGDSRAALENYEQARTLRQCLPEADQAAGWAQRDLYVSHNKLGDVYLRLGDAKAARDSYQSALEAAQHLADANETSAQAQRDLSVSHNKLGDAYMELGDTKAARDGYQKALELRQRLADADPASVQAQRDLSIAHNKVGDACLRLRENKAALASYKSCHTILERLAEADKTSARTQRDLSVSDLKLGDVYLQMGNHRGALASYQKALPAARRLADADPTSAQAQRDLSIAYAHRGDVYLDMGNLTAALADYTEALKLRQGLADADKTDARAQRDLCGSYGKLGTVAQQGHDFKAALGWYDRALDVARQFPRPEFFRREVASLNERVRFCRAAEQAVADPATALQHPANLRRPVLVAAISTLATKEKNPEKAVAAADMLAGIAGGPDDLYNAACGYALCVPLADKAQTKEQYAGGAVELLRQAVAKGFRDVDQIRSDPDLAALRQREDYKKLLTEVEAATEPKDRKQP
jgi:serine/threonine protein kinase/predicted negative regulator of RcsB-dependent stress response